MHPRGWGINSAFPKTGKKLAPFRENRAETRVFIDEFSQFSLQNSPFLNQIMLFSMEKLQKRDISSPFCITNASFVSSTKKVSQKARRETPKTPGEWESRREKQGKN